MSDQAVAVTPIPDSELEFSYCVQETYERFKEIAREHGIWVLDAGLLLVIKDLMNKGYIEIGPNLRG